MYGAVTMERYEAYKDSGVEWIGEIPAGWDLRRAKTAFTARRTKGNTELVQLAATQDRGMIPQSELDGVVQVSEDADLTQFRTVRKDDFVISLRSFQGGFELSRHEGVCSPAYQVFYGNDAICTSYFKHLFKSDAFISKMNSLTVGIREGKNIQFQDFASSMLAFPPIVEQQVIADYLDTRTAEIDELIADCEREVELLQEYRKAVISEAVTKGLDPDAPMKDSGIEWIGEIPSSWVIVPYKAIGSVIANLQDPVDYPDLPQVSPDRIEKDSGRLLPCVSVAEVGVESDNHLFHAGDILYSKVRPALNKVTVAPFDGMCSADMYPIGTSQNRRWLVFYMLSNAFMEQVIVSTDRVKMPKINKEELGAFKVVLPDADTQSEIVAYLDAKTAEIDTLIEAKQSIADKLREYRRSLISEAVTGKFMVPVV